MAAQQPDFLPTLQPPERGPAQRGCVHQLFEAQAQRAPSALAASYGARQSTYADLNRRANQLAWRLKQLEVRRDVPVGLSLGRGIELAAALLAVMKAGGACLPLDPDYPAERLTYMQADAQAPVLLVGAGRPNPFGGESATILRLDESWAEFASESSANPDTGVRPDDLAYIIYTSGSTGKPRGVQLPHRGLVNHHLAAVALYGLTPQDRVLQSASISFDISVEEMFPAWSAGAAVIFRTDEVSLQPARFLDWIREQRITVLDLPTAYWHELVHQLQETPQPLPRPLRLVVVGGEKASASAFQIWTQHAGGRVRWMNTYGPTEACVIATSYEPSGRDPADDSELPIGRPIANTRIHILDSHLRPVPPGETGEIFIAGAGLARGYLNRPELTAAKFVPDPFEAEPGARMYATSDLGRLLEDGNIEFRGRTDHQVKIRGYRVEPEEIEVVLGQHPGVRQALVLAKEDPALEKRLVAYFLPASGPPPRTAELRDFLKTKLPEYMIPFAFVPMQAFPLTPNGKVDRKAVALVPVSLDASTESYVQPRNPLESRMVTLWENVLGIQPIGVRQSFFELGGNSLLALRLMHRMEQEFGKTLPPAALFQAPTIEQMAAFLSQEAWAPRWVCLVPIQPAGSKPPFFCVHGLGGHVLRFGPLARNLGNERPFYALQARGLDGQYPCDTSVEAMAEHYIAEIRSLQPEGPYHLGGYSFGGAVAYEMARQLQAAGQQVSFLALLDTYPGLVPESGSLIGTFLGLSLLEKWTYLVSKRKMVFRRIRARIEALTFPPALKQVLASNRIAEKSYQWPAYAGPVCLFRASEKGLRGRAGLPEHGAHWKIIELTGDHGTIIREPKVRDLASRIQTCLEQASTQSSMLEVSR